MKRYYTIYLLNNYHAGYNSVTMGYKVVVASDRYGWLKVAEFSDATEAWAFCFYTKLRKQLQGHAAVYKRLEKADQLRKFWR